MQTPSLENRAELGLGVEMLVSLEQNIRSLDIVIDFDRWFVFLLFCLKEGGNRITFEVCMIKPMVKIFTPIDFPPPL